MAFWRGTGIVLRWGLQGLMALAFVAIGLGKFGNAFWEKSFAHWGYPAGFHLVIGTIEAACGVLLLVPRLTSYAAALLSIVMLGAVATHAIWGEAWTRPLPHLVFLLVLAWIRWPHRWRRAAVATAAAPAGAPARS